MSNPIDSAACGKSKSCPFNLKEYKSSLYIFTTSASSVSHGSLAKDFNRSMAMHCVSVVLRCKIRAQKRVNEVSVRTFSKVFTTSWIGLYLEQLDSYSLRSLPGISNSSVGVDHPIRLQRLDLEGWLVSLSLPVWQLLWKWLQIIFISSLFFDSDCFFDYTRLWVTSAWFYPR